jgi:hypothetical protein
MSEVNTFPRRLGAPVASPLDTAMIANLLDHPDTPQTDSSVTIDFEMVATDY